MGVLLFLLSTTHVNFPAHLHTHALLPISSHQGNGIAPVSSVSSTLITSSYPRQIPFQNVPCITLRMILLNASLVRYDMFEDLGQVSGRRETERGRSELDEEAEGRHAAAVGEIIEWRPAARPPALAVPA